MKPKTTIVLLAVLVTCVGYVVIRYSLKRPTPLPRERRVLRSKPGEAKQLTIASADESKIVFTKRDNTWKIVEPIQAKADAYEVNRLVDELIDLRYVRRVEKDHKDADPELTGLDKPSWTLTLIDTKDASYTVYVGKPVPLMRPPQTYVRRAKDDRTYTVEMDLAGKLGRPLGDYRDKRLFDIRTSDVVRLAVTGPQKAFELTKTDEQWRMVKPVSAKVDKDEVRSLLNRIVYLKVTEFVEDRPQQLSRFGLDKPHLIASLWVKPPSPPTTAPTTAPATSPTEKPKEYTLALGRRTEDQVYAKLPDEPAVFTVEASLLEDLQPDPVELRDKQILSFERDEVISVDLELPGGKAVLKKQEEKWNMIEPFEGPANDTEISFLLNDMSSLKAESFEDVDPVRLVGFGLDSPRGRITLGFSGKSQTQTLLIGRKSPSGEMTFIKAAHDSSVAVVRSAYADPLLALPARYWEATLLELGKDEIISQLLVKRKNGAFTLQRDADTWLLTRPVKGSAERGNVEKILGHLTRLTARKIVALGTKVPKPYRTAKGRITVSFTTRLEPTSQPATSPAQEAPAAATSPDAEIKSYVLRVVKHLGKVYAWVEGRKVLGVGECSQSLYNDLSAELRDRKVLQINPDRIEQIKILPGKDALELRRQRDKDTDQWRSAADPYVKIDPDKVVAFLKDIQEIHAEEFVVHRASPADATKHGLTKPWLVLELTLDNQPPVRITVSPKGKDPQGRYATVTGIEGIFMLSGETTGKLAKKLQDFKK